MAAIAGRQRRGMATGGRKPNAGWDVLSAMLVFLDFEASSLGKRSYPIEVGWVFEDGRSEAHLIRPAPEWTDWDAQAEAVQHIPRDLLLREGAPHDVVAQRMIEALEGHDLLASAPSWDGKWLSALLRSPAEYIGILNTSLNLRLVEQVDVCRCT